MLTTLACTDYTIMNKTLLEHTNVYTSSEYVESLPLLTTVC